MAPDLLVILCTHNPRADYLAATLAALRTQTLPASAWSLLVIDNASPQPIAPTLDLAWSPGARVVREDRLGIAHARHRALREARDVSAALVLFVDDDNVLAPDYLEQGLAIAILWPQLGAWGGQLVARYESAPPAWAQPYLKYLAITELGRDRWTNHVDNYDSVPPTAGCFLSAAVRRGYLELLERDPRHLALGPQGSERVGGEDTDLMLTAIDLGLGLGRFQRLRLEHLIPGSRLTPGYLAALLESITLGTGLLEYLRFARTPRAPARNPVERLIAA